MDSEWQALQCILEVHMSRSMHMELFNVWEIDLVASPDAEARVHTIVLTDGVDAAELTDERVAVWCKTHYRARAVMLSDILDSLAASSLNRVDHLLACRW